MKVQRFKWFKSQLNFPFSFQCRKADIHESYCRKQRRYRSNRCQKACQWHGCQRFFGCSIREWNTCQNAPIKQTWSKSEGTTFGYSKGKSNPWHEAGISQDVIAAKYNINRSLVSKWHSDRVKILACAASEYKKHLKIRPARKYNELYRQFLIDFKTARSKGHRVNFGWLWSKARTIYRKQKNDPNVIVRKHVITAFIKRHGIRMRARQRNRKQSKEAFRNDLMKWHAFQCRPIALALCRWNETDIWNRWEEPKSKSQGMDQPTRKRSRQASMYLASLL